MMSRQEAAAEKLTNEMATLNDSIAERNGLLRALLVILLVGTLGIFVLIATVWFYLPSAERASNRNTNLLHNHICAEAEYEKREARPVSIVCPPPGP